MWLVKNPQGLSLRGRCLWRWFKTGRDGLLKTGLLGMSPRDARVPSTAPAKSQIAVDLKGERGRPVPPVSKISVSTKISWNRLMFNHFWDRTLISPSKIVFFPILNRNLCPPQREPATQTQKVRTWWKGKKHPKRLHCNRYSKMNRDNKGLHRFTSVQLCYYLWLWMQGRNITRRKRFHCYERDIIVY